MDKCKKKDTCKSVQRCLSCYGTLPCFVPENADKMKSVEKHIRFIIEGKKYTISEIKEIFSIGMEVFKNKKILGTPEAPAPRDEGDAARDLITEEWYKKTSDAT